MTLKVGDPVSGLPYDDEYIWSMGTDRLYGTYHESTFTRLGVTYTIPRIKDEKGAVIDCNDIRKEDEDAE